MKLPISRFISIFVFVLLFANFTFAQTESEKGVQLYEKGDFKAAIENLQKVVKENPNDAEAQTYLSLSLIKVGRVKEAEIALGKTLALDSSQLKARKALTYIFLQRGKSEEAIRQAKYLLSQDVSDAEMYYILGAANLRLNNTDAALENAEQSIKLDAKFPDSYLVKAQALMNQKTEAEDYSAIAAKYRAASDSLNSFVELSNDSPESALWRKQQENLKFFIDYYDEKQKSSVGREENKNQMLTPINILTKPLAAYTDQARQMSVTGSIKLTVAFLENGATPRVLVLSSLGYGMDESAIKAAEKMKYEPAMQNGKPITTIKQLTYSFTLY